MCSICLENIDNKVKVTLKCEHYFCKPCIDEWLKAKTFCPMCRNKEREEEVREPTFRELLFFHAEIDLDLSISSDSDSTSNSDLDLSISSNSGLELDSDSDSDLDLDSGYSNSRDVSEENSDIEEPPLTITLNMLSAEIMTYLHNWLRLELTESESHNA